MRRHRRINRRTAEELLRGDAIGRSADPDPLADLLAAAAAPVRDSELVGEAAALAAFRSVRLDPVAEPRRDSMVRTTFAKVLTAKAAAVVVATAASGVAVAAGTGHLTSVTGNEHPVTPTHRPTTNDHTARPVPSTNAPGHSPRTTHHSPGAGAPSPSFAGLCNAYVKGVADSSGRALENPAFTALIRAAGGKDKVVAYCAPLLEDQQHGPGPESDNHADSGNGSNSRGNSGQDGGTENDHGQTGNDGHAGNQPTDDPQPKTHSTRQNSDSGS